MSLLLLATSCQPPSAPSATGRFQVNGSGLSGQLFGETAEDRVALKLSQNGPNDPLLRVGVGVPGTEIDFMTGTNYDPGTPANSNVFSMGEVKTGNPKNFTSHAKEKFEEAARHKADRFQYLLDTNSQQSLNERKKQLKEIAHAIDPDTKQELYPNFDAERDVSRLRDVIPELNSCDK